MIQLVKNEKLELQYREKLNKKPGDKILVNLWLEFL